MPAARRGPARWLTLLVAIVGALAVLGLVAFWPRGDAPDLGDQPNDYVDATVRAVDSTTCEDPDVEASGPCRIVTAELTSGPDRGDSIEFRVTATELDVPDLAVGDRVVLHDIASAPDEFRYSFADFQRDTPLWWLLGGFVAVVVVFGRWQGVRALAGLAASGLLLVAFLVPALLRDQPAVLVALAATVAIAFIALYLAHGVSTGTTVALAGTVVSLALTAGLALVVAEAAHLTGLADETSQTLRVTAGALDLRGLLVAGIVVGALGVLDDVTVSQVSIVSTLRRANPGLRGRSLYREATTVGRDHVASTVNTLVLAYAGASLPLLLFFAQGDQPVGRLLAGELIAVEIVRMLVGSIGLVVSVPVTTALAAAVLGPGDDGVGHSYGRIGEDPIADGGGPDGPPPAHVAANGGGRRRGRRRRGDADELAPAEDT